jgi:ABC-2 type transport system ATP-binding protein
MRQLRDAAERAGRPAALVTDGLTKRYGNRLAVDALSIEVPAGVVAGFIGPNGAGKTTASTSPHRSA